MFDDDLLDDMDAKQGEMMSKDPVLLLLFSGGFYPDEGRNLLKDVIACAEENGFRHTFVVDHPDGYDMKGSGYDPYPEYIKRCEEEIDKDPDRAGRPLVIFGHSRGCCGGMALATYFEDRVIKTFLCACGPIALGTPTMWENLSKHFQTGGDDLILEWLFSMQPGNLILPRALEVARRDPEGELQKMYADSKWLRNMVGLTRLQYKEAMYPLMTGDDPVIQKVHCDICAVCPLKDPGATPEVMAGWENISTGKFQMLEVDAGHIDILQAEKKKGQTIKFPLGDAIGPEFAKLIKK